MYLYDRVAQCREQERVQDSRGRVHRVPGPADVAAQVRACSTRYVLDESLRDICLELICNRPEVIRLEDACYRIPHQTMWIEWIDLRSANASGGGSRRAGLLVLADESGRRGTVHGFNHHAEGDPWAAQIFFEFDFDNSISDEKALCGLDFGDVRDRAAVHRLYRHCAGRIDHRWLQFFRAEGGLPQDALQGMMRGCLPDFGVLCAFLLLLSLECARTEPRQGLDKINRARARAGRSLLLDHVEVSLRLASVAPAGGGAGRQDRTASRLHQVRGHLVRRGGKTFWRSHHLRGDAARGVVASRTVHVSGNQEAVRRALG